jgi:hypothetical protein
MVADFNRLKALLGLTLIPASLLAFSAHSKQ